METASWRKSSHSVGHDYGNCVECASFRRSSFCPPGHQDCVEAGSWRKSRASVHVADACVETGHGPGVVGVRDTQLGSASPVLEFSPAAWGAFLGRLR